MILHTTPNNRRIMLFVARLVVFFVTFSLIVSCNCESSDESTDQEVDLKNITKDSNVSLLWEQFKRTYNRDYGTGDVNTKKFEIFAENVKKITDHNELFNKGEETYKQGLNEFSDYTAEEFRARGAGLG